MPEISNLVVIHYGDHLREDGRQHPVDEDMFPGRQDYAKLLRERFDLRLAITHRTSPVAAGFEPPFGPQLTVEVDYDPQFTPQADGSDKYAPRYTEQSCLLNELGAALILDKDVDGFQREDPTTRQRRANGIGVDPRFIINPWAVQDMGNQKEDTGQRLLQPFGVALETFPASEEGIVALQQQFGDTRIVAKPDGYALGKGIVFYDNPQALQHAIREGKVPPNTLLEPFVGRKSQIPNLRAYHAKDRSKLQAINNNVTEAVVRELRMHFGAYKDSQGNIQAWAFPSLRFNKTTDEVMGANCDFIALDPAYLPNDTMHDTTLDIARRVLTLTEASQAYGSADWVFPQAMDAFVGETNLRGPHIAYDADPARNALIDMIGTVARRNIAAT